MILRASWQHLYENPMAIHNDLEGFQYVGDGWYQDGKNTAYVVTQKDGGIMFYAFIGFDPRKEMGHLISRPSNGKGRPDSKEATVA